LFIDVSNVKSLVRSSNELEDLLGT
jgi:hypothetical protein